VFSGSSIFGFAATQSWNVRSENGRLVAGIEAPCSCLSSLFRAGVFNPLVFELADCGDRFSILFCAALALILASVVSTAVAVLLEWRCPFRMFQLTLLVGSDFTIQFGATSGFPGVSCLKSFRFPDGMDPHRVLVPNAPSDTKSGRGIFNVDALIVFFMSPDAGFDRARVTLRGAIAR
jgi:hypothetical protein